MFHEPKAYTLRFLRKEQVASDAYSFYFEKKDIAFLPGQYMKVSLQIPNPDERGTTRFFTIASSPSEDLLMITTRIIRSSFKKTLASLEEGTEVIIFGPLGRFILDETDLTPRVFLAGGIGITPFRSMIVYASSKKLPIPITLITSSRTLGDMIYREELHTIQQEYNHLTLVETLTEPEDPEAWHGRLGRVNEELLKDTIPDIHIPTYYISGPATMVEGISSIVKSLGISEDRIRTENFSGY